MLISHHTTTYKNELAFIVIAIDITGRINNEKKILAQNEKLKEIAWSNSHEIRKPVSNILGIVNLMLDSHEKAHTDPELLKMLSFSVNELDKVIKAVNEKANTAIE